MQNNDKPKTETHHHHILSNKTAILVFVALMILTVITVAVGRLDLGSLNFFVAMVIATIKGLLVALIFMNLAYDHRENGIIFATSFLFLAIFMVLTSTDMFFRGDVYVKGPLMAAQGKSKFKTPWVPSPELIAHGKELFTQQCVTCHGNEGHGDGPGSSGLAKRPRNFTQNEGWINGRKPSQIFKTLKEGLPGGMPTFATLPQDDRWSLAHFVNSLGPAPQPKDDAHELAELAAAAGGTGGAAEEPTIPVEFAIERLAKEAGR